MQLYIVRHGIAIDREEPKCPPDPERFLTEEGKDKTQQVAKGLAKLGVIADVFLSSPYRRAKETAEIFAAELEYAKAKVRYTNALLPSADAAMLFRELAKDKDAGTAMIFGHAPHLDEVLAAAVGSKHQITALKKAGVALVELKRVSPPSGELLWLATPKLLRNVGK
jgi:phosphohistidine phosphatase